MDFKTSPKIIVLIPAYNAEKTIEQLATEIRGVLPKIIVVDDGSSDSTVEKARRAGCEVIVHDINQGKGGALRTGFHKISEMDYDWIVIMDADGQHLPQDLPKFIQMIKEGKYSFINGTRLKNAQKMPLIRLYTNKVMSGLVSSILKTEISDTQCGYKAFNTELIRKGRFFSRHFEIEDELIFEAVRLHFSIGHVEVETVYRDEESYINPLVDTFRFLLFLFRYSFKR